MPVTPVTDWGTAVVSSAAAALALLLGGIPKILGFLVILGLGWLVASAIAGIVSRVLSAVNFNELAERSGLGDFVRKAGIRMTPSRVVGEISKWFIRLIALTVAFDALGLPAVSDVLRSMLLFLPNVIVALVVLVLGGLAAKALGTLIRGALAEAGVGNPDVLAMIAQGAVWAFAIVVAVNQIGVASTLVNTLFMAFTFGLAGAFTIAFGLGARPTAEKIVADWYTQAQSAAPKAKRVASAAKEEAEEQAEHVEARTSNGRHR